MREKCSIYSVNSQKLKTPFKPCKQFCKDMNHEIRMKLHSVEWMSVVFIVVKGHSHRGQDYELNRYWSFYITIQWSMKGTYVENNSGWTVVVTPVYRLLVWGLRVHLWLSQLAGRLSQVISLLTQHLLQLSMELLLLHLPDDTGHQAEVSGNIHHGHKPN